MVHRALAIATLLLWGQLAGAQTYPAPQAAAPVQLVPVQLVQPGPIHQGIARVGDYLSSWGRRAYVRLPAPAPPAVPQVVSLAPVALQPVTLQFQLAATPPTQPTAQAPIPAFVPPGPEPPPIPAAAAR